MGRKSLIPEIEAKLGKTLREYLPEAIKGGKDPAIIAQELGISKSLLYDEIKKLGLKAKLKDVKYTAAAGVKEGELKKWIDDYIEWKRMSNFSKATIQNTRDILYAYLWWLDFAKIPADLAHSINDTEGGVVPFFQYLRTATDRFGGKSTSSHKPMKSITLKAYNKNLSAFITWLQKREIVEDSTLRKMKLAVPTPKVEKRIPEDIPDEIISKMMDSFNNSFDGIRNKTMTTWFLETGMRREGVVNLRMNQFNMETGWGSIVEKGNKERSIHISQALSEQLKIYLPMREKLAKCDYLWVHEDGTHFDENNFKYVYAQLNKKFHADLERLVPGTKGIHMHGFRHVFARFMVENNIGIQAIADMGGWESWDLVQLYARAHQKKLAWNEFEKASPLKKIKETENETAESN